MSGRRVSLDGQWHFRADPGQEGLSAQWQCQPVPDESWAAVPIPGPWDQHGRDGHEGVGWYRRGFEIPPSALGQPCGICLAGVDDSATVWVNGVEVASQSPVRARFACNIDRLAKPGKNTIVIRVPDRGTPGGSLRTAWLGSYRTIEELIRGEHSGTLARPSPDWVRDAVVYEVYLRSFSAAGTFRGLQQRLDELRELGVTVLWLMPIHAIGQSRQKGPLGSLYSISDYYAVNPEFGRLDDFQALLAAAHERGLRLIIDLVANHTAWDSHLLRAHPDWFARDERGEVRSPLDDWHDVAQLDYSVPELRRYMTEMMLYWLREVGVDGLRCDVAGMLPTDFWNETRHELDAVRPIMMLAEDDQPAQHEHAFDLTYDWRTYQALGRLRAGRLRPLSIATILTDEQLDFPAGSLHLRFSSNHDLCAWHQPGMQRYGPQAAKAAAVLTFALPGVPLIYNGQEVGNCVKLPLFERVPIDWEPAGHFDLRALYACLGRLRRQHASLRRGQARIPFELPETDVLAITRTWQHEMTCVLINCALEPREIETGATPLGDVTTLLSTTTPAASGPARAIELPPLGFWIGTAR